MSATRQPLPVELLASDYQRRSLETALDTSLPIPASAHEDCNACRRKLNLNAVDMPPTNCRKESDISRVIGILDEIQLREETH